MPLGTNYDKLNRAAFNAVYLLCFTFLFCCACRSFFSPKDYAISSSSSSHTKVVIQFRQVSDDNAGDFTSRGRIELNSMFI